MGPECIRCVLLDLASAGGSMTGKEFMKAVANGKTDPLETLLRILAETSSAYCVIGGLAVNAYVEPVVSLDLDIVVVAEGIDKVCAAAQVSGLLVQEFEHSINLSATESDLRIQLQTDPRYQAFVARATAREVLGYRMFIANLQDVLQGKIWAWSDDKRRQSKRQKDLADIMRLVEAHPSLKNDLPPEIFSRIE